MNTQGSQENRELLVTFLFTAGIICFLFPICFGSLALFVNGGPEIFPTLSITTLIGIGLIIAGMWFKKRSSFREPSSSSLLVLFAVPLLFLLCSSYPDRAFNFWQGRGVRGEIFLAAILLTLCFRYAKTEHVKTLFGVILPVLFSVLSLWAFFKEANGRILLSDDHATFIYRLSLLKENFPHIPHYNPLWNGGIEARDYFASGALAPYLLFWPVIQYFDVWTIYNLIVATIFFILLPGATYLATRLMNYDRVVAGIAVLLALCSSQLWYRWGFKYGVLGCCVAAIFIPVVIASVTRLTSAEESRSPKPWEILLFFVSISIAVLWPFSGVILAPALLTLPWAAPRLRRSRFFWICAALALLVHLPWMIEFLKGSNVGTFLQLERVTNTTDRAVGLSTTESSWAGAQQSLVLRGTPYSDWRDGVKHTLRANSSLFNPLILIGAITGLFFLKRTKSSGLLIMMLTWLLFLALVVGPLKPQLELERMLMFAGIIAAPFVAILLRAFIVGEQTWGQSFLTAFVSATLLIGNINAIGTIQNRSSERYFWSESIYFELAEAIKKYGGEGRVIFPGFILHDLAHAHIAPLALLSGKPLAASVPTHKIWWYSELVPKEFSEKGDTGIETYLDLMNTTAIVVHEPKWIQFAQRNSERYRLRWERESFRLYERVGAVSNYFLEGSGQVLSIGSSEVTLKVDNAKTILKFNYTPQLKVRSDDKGCTVVPFAVGSTVQFVQLQHCEKDEVVLSLTD